MARSRAIRSPAPFLKRVWLDTDDVPDTASYPYDLPLFREGRFELSFDRAITIVAGENGVGKSTLLEAIAVVAGFDESGGGPGYRAVDNSRARERSGHALAAGFKASWLPKISAGWFFRAESFFAVARYLDDVGSPSADFLSHSHGEGFMRFFEERCMRPGLFIFDEPESALSPNRQFEFMRLLRRMQIQGNIQVIMATHSPLLMALPGVTLWKMGRHGLQPTELEETDHFTILRQFALDPHHFVRAMLDE